MKVVYDPDRNLVIVVGGEGNMVGDHWEWDGTSWHLAKKDEDTST